MKPIVSPRTMRSLDADSAESIDALIARAGWLVADRARGLLGGTYGRTIDVLCGPGNNGADGRVAAAWLSRWGVRVRVHDLGALPTSVPDDSDLVIDAVFGTGFRGEFRGPSVPPSVPVLAVDVPSGVDGATGETRGEPLRATLTVTFAALKPGTLLVPGALLAGDIEVVDVGVEVPESATADWWVEVDDVRRWPRRLPTDHKWTTAVWVIGGSGSMSGALELVVAGAQRAGSGYVRASTPGAEQPVTIPTEAVAFGLPLEGWAEPVLATDRNFGALVVGPGLAVTGANAAAVQDLAARWAGPLVLDAGALDAMGDRLELLTKRNVPAVLTPHDGELRRLGADLAGTDRVAAIRNAAADLGAVVLAKGPATLVADPAGAVAYVSGGALCGHDARLATAGSGDVLAGVIGAGLAGGLAPFEAAYLAAELHALAAAAGQAAGLVAGDLPPLVADVLSRLTSEPG